MGKKYSKLPGIQSLHDFHFTKHPVTNALIAKTRKFCHIGMFENAGIHVHRGKDIHECAIPHQESENYTSLGKLRPLSEFKHKHLEQMYRDSSLVIVSTIYCGQFRENVNQGVKISKWV